MGVLMIDRIESLKTDWITRQPKPLNPELADEEAS